MPKSIVALALFFTSSFAIAQAQTPLAAEMAKHALVISLEDNDLRGPGADLLDRELAATQFFLIGEDHGFAEVPRISVALLRRGSKHGYKHLALEVGPLTIARLAEAGKRDPYAAVVATNRRYPWALPFLNWDEEAHLYAEAMKLGDVWGIDQEFVMSPRMHFERLLDLARSDAARDVIKAMIERVKTGEAEMVAKHSPITIFFVTAKAEDFAALRNAFAKDARPEVGRLLDAIEQSWSIYAKNFTGDIYGNNAQRAQLMKRYFREAYASAAKREALPKVMFKLGASHMMRGRTLADVFDLGSLLPELAAANGTRSFQLLILAGGGRVNQYRPFSTSEDERNAPYSVKYSGVDLKPLTAAAPAGQWTLFDLRPLRPLLAKKKLGDLDEGLRDFLWGYDAILVIPEATAAANIR